MSNDIRKNKAIAIGLGIIAVILTILPTAAFAIINWDLISSAL